MKVLSSLIISIILCLVAPSYAIEDTVKVFIDEDEVKFDVPPLIQNGRTLVPLRAIFEGLGAIVEWNEETRTITGTKGKTKVTLLINSKIATVNNKIVTLDAPAISINGRTLVPARFIGESLGMDVKWDNNTRRININKTPDTNSINSSEAKIKPTIAPISNNLDSITGKKDYYVTTIFLDGKIDNYNESNATTMDEMVNMRNDLAKLDSNLHVTWSLSTEFVFDEENRDKLQYIKNMADLFGDEIGIGYGFPNNNESLESFIEKMNQWMYMYRYNLFTEKHVNDTCGESSVFESIPQKYRPTSFSTYAINNEQAQWLRDTWNIYAIMGWSATQYNVDQLTGDGSPLMPYWSHRNNPLVPAQNKSENSGIVFLNTITIDPVGCTYTSGESRWTIHPADPSTEGQEQIYTLNQYLSNPYKDKNSINYVSLFIDINWISRNSKLKNSWDKIINYYSGKEKFSVVGIKEFVDKWIEGIGSDNDKANFSLMFRGSGLEVAGNKSSSDTRYLWTETKQQRIILKKTDSEKQWTVIDFTDYSGEIPKLKYTTRGREEDISFVTGRNFKLSQSTALTADQSRRIANRLKEIGFNEQVQFF